MAGLTWHKLTRRKQTQTGGQEEGYMMALQMDPAPGRAAGKGKVEKVWDPKKKRCSSPMHDNEPGASSMHDDEHFWRTFPMICKEQRRSKKI